MKSIVAVNNAELLATLDSEGILLSDYLTMLVEKSLIEAGVIKTKSAENLLNEL